MPVLDAFNSLRTPKNFLTRVCFMAGSVSRILVLGTLATLVLILIVHVYLFAPQLSPLPSKLPNSLNSSDRFHSITPAKSKYAYVVFIGRDFQNNSGPDDLDTYFVGSRVLTYQLLHAPRTHTNTSLDVVVLATTDVKASKLERLALDGARVQVVDRVTSPWIKMDVPRWRDVLTKLRVCALTEYEKVLYMDADMLLVDRMDDIFADQATQPQISNLTLADPSEPALPPTYMLAAQAIQNQRVHPYPPDPGDYFSAGFFLCQPSLALYDYYISLTQSSTLAAGDDDDGSNKQQKFDPFLGEQNLLNYAHRRNGPMPWRDVHYTWTTTWPSWREVSKGAKSLHEKWWLDDLPGMEDERNRKLQQRWWQTKREMEEFYRVRDVAKGVSKRLGKDRRKKRVGSWLKGEVG